MEITWTQALILFSSAFFLVGFLTPLVRKLAIRLDVIDEPGELHKTHLRPIPYLGGVAIVVGIVVVTFAAILNSGDLELIGLASTVLLPAIFMGFIGLIDDIKKLSPWPRFVAQNTVGLVIAQMLIFTNTLGVPTGNQFTDILITVFWIVGITNSINFYDNIDGGASGTVAIASMFLCFLALYGDQDFIAALSMVLSGATAGFLIWNKSPARIYMGDAGALFLGVLIASLTLRFDPNPTNKLASYSVPVLLMALPIMDTTVVVLSRLKRRISPFHGGQDHLSHRLISKGIPKRQAVFILWLLTTIFAILAIVISLTPSNFEEVILVFALTLWLSCFTAFLKMQSQ